MRKVIVMVVVLVMITGVAYCDSNLGDIMLLNKKKNQLQDEIRIVELRRTQVKDRLSKGIDYTLKELYELELDILEQDIKIKRKELEKINAVVGNFTRVTNSSGLNEIIKTYTKTSQKLKGGKMSFTSPLKNYTFTSGYGFREHPIYKRRIFHNGVDLAAKKGTNIRAIESGLVVKAGNLSGYGNTVILMHRRGYMSMYGHMSDIKVKTGDAVRRGEVIGYVGSTGISTGDHLHLEVFKDGKRINPEKLIHFKK